MKTKHFVIIVSILGIALRIARIWSSPLWYDELYSYLLGGLPLDRLLAATAGDVHPPLHYLTIWPIVQAGLPAWMIRIPSLLFSIGALWLFWLVLDELFLFRPALRYAAFTLMAIAPVQIYYAQEGRMYALLEFLVLASVLAMLRQKWGWYIVASIAMLYTQNYGVIYLACIWMVGILLPIQWSKLTASTAAAGIAWIPWAIVVVGQMNGMHGHHWIPAATPGNIAYTFYQLFTIPAGNAKIELITVAVFFIWLSLACFYYARWAWKYPIEPTLILSMAFVPALLATVISWIWQPILLYRPLIGSSPFVYILLCMPLAYLPTLRSRLYVSIFLVPVLLVNLMSIYVNTADRKAGDSAIDRLAYIEANWQPGDAVYHISDGSWINMAPYADVSVGAHHKSLECGIVYGGLSSRTRTAIGETVLPFEDVPGTRIWVITSDTALNPLCEAEAISQYISGLDPITCTEDEYASSCIYLVNR